MLILHIDTSGPSCTVFVSQDGVVLSTRSSAGEREHAATINLLIAEILQECGRTLNDMDAFSVCNGPGSYTGLRIGLGTAKGFCYALDKPLILHSRLELLLRDAAENNPSQKNFLAILPARTGEYYIAAKVNGIVHEPAHAFTTHIVALLRTVPDTICIGEAGEDVLSYCNTPLISHSSPSPKIWIAAVVEAYNERAFADVAYAEPYYLKAAFTTTSKKKTAF